MRLRRNMKMLLCLVLCLCMICTNQNVFAAISQEGTERNESESTQADTILESEVPLETEKLQIEDTIQSIESNYSESEFSKDVMNTDEDQSAETMTEAVTETVAESNIVENFTENPTGVQTDEQTNVPTDDSEETDMDLQAKAEIMNKCEVQIDRAHITKVNGIAVTENEIQDYIEAGKWNPCFEPGTELEIAADHINTGDYSGYAFKMWRGDGCLIQSNDIFSPVVTITVPAGISKIDLNAKEIIYINGAEAVAFGGINEYIESVDGVVDNYGKWIAVGTKIQLEAPEFDENGNPFIEWYAGYESASSKLDFSDQAFEDKTNRKTVMTVLPEMNATYSDHTYICPVYASIAAKSLQIGFAGGVVNQYEGEVLEKTDTSGNTVYECKAGAKLYIEWNAEKEEGFDHVFRQWHVRNGRYYSDEIIGKIEQELIEDEQNQQTVLHVTDEVLSMIGSSTQSQTITVYGEYERIQNNAVMCEVYVENGKILSVDGVSTDAYNTPASEGGEPFAKGNFKPGTVLVMENLAERQGMWVNLSDFVGSFFGPYEPLGIFQTDSCARVVTYLVPDSPKAHLTGDSGNYAWGDGPMTVHVKGGQIIGENGIGFAKPVTERNFDHGQMVTIQAVVPEVPEGADYKYVFDHWETYDGYPLRFEDKNAEITEASTAPYHWPDIWLYAIFKTVPVEYGSIEVIPDIEEGAPSIYLSKEDVETSVLTEDEQNLIKEGVDITVTTSVKVITDVNSADDKLIEANKNDYEKAQILDIEMFKQIGDSEREKITETLRPITLCINIPDNCKITDGNRTFSMLRIHNGTATLLQDLDSNADTITISTNQFSTYVLLYKDAAQEPQETEEPSESEKPGESKNPSESEKPDESETIESDNDNQSAPSEKPSDSEENSTVTNNDDGKTQSESPKTGDMTQVMSLISILMASVVVILYIVMAKKKKYRH